MRNAIAMGLFCALMAAPRAGAQTPPAASPAPADASAALAQQMSDLLKELRALRVEIVNLRQAVSTLRTAGAAPSAPVAPPAPASLRLDDSPALGSATAPVAIVEFSEFQCPYCRRHFDQTFSSLRQNYIDTGKVRYVFRNFPLVEIHPNAKAAAVAAYCAGEQGAYWKMHDALFTNQPRLGPALYDELAKSLDLDAKKFQACREARESEKKIEDDMAYGQSVGVQGTPHFFIGRLKGGQVVDLQRVSGAQPLPAFTQVIDSLLKDGAAARN
ncbi:MAG: thioredoxin [Acidobacteria bacterium]|nr:MAG: thioredoxin [Acidobacteriota bacterium]